ncbi:Aspartic proteinase Asp1, partial [Cucurbita argyrosperma subsp. sororia]
MRMSNLFPVFVLFAAFVLSLSGKLCFADRKPSVINRPSSSIVFPVKGNVYPLGHFTASVNVGNPPKVFDLDIDTGSDVTWVQCDAPCTGCTLPRDKLYKPHNNVVRCGEPLCAALFHQGKPPCRNPNDQCDYQIEYADHGSSIGVLVKDLVPMKLANGTVIAPNLGFGCGYDQHNGGSQPPPSTGGVLGLGNSKGTLASQISSLTHVRSVIGHCYSGHGGGFLFFGGDLVPSSGISWTPILHTSGGRYSSGPADVFFGGKAVGIRGLTLTFDSGSSYTYFNSQVYGAILNTLRNDLKGQPLKDAPEEKILPVCWKGSKAFKSVADVRSFFKPLALSFTNSRNAQFQMPPESYLIISELGNVCLGILDGSQVGLGNVNLIGDISFLDKIVVYDNEKQQIGWAPANCSRPRKQ